MDVNHQLRSSEPATQPQQTYLPSIDTPHYVLDPSSPSQRLDEIDSDEEGSTISLDQESFEVNIISGREFKRLKGTEYWAPSDDLQQVALDAEHSAQYPPETKDPRLFEAPIGEQPQAILDLGAGTGIWAICCADRFPSAHVIGVDISPSQPVWVPPNVAFQIDDIENVPWTFKSDTIDLVHIRNMGSSIKDWDPILCESMRVLKPGGWIEVVQLDFAADEVHAPAWEEWEALSKQFLTSRGHEANSSAYMTSWMEETGFKDVRLITAKIPGWPYTYDCVGKILSVLADLGWPSQEINMQALQMKVEARNYWSRHFFTSTSVCGQKVSAVY